ncbi:hypothetical protein RUM43_008313, partial [Polyplax serrata]
MNEDRHCAETYPQNKETKNKFRNALTAAAAAAGITTPSATGVVKKQMENVALNGSLGR